ncbi:MAG: hypothetical protein KC713_05565 [Candidatus Omnitrophica bacterium]|nr:hypothetical protein [Candidatus Omnitrophota bacterium]
MKKSKIVILGVIIIAALGSLFYIRSFKDAALGNEYYQKALSVNDQHTLVFSEPERDKLYALGIKAYQRALGKCPFYFGYYRAVGTGLTYLKDYPAAEDSFKKAAMLGWPLFQPKNYYNKMMIFYSQTEDRSKARRFAHKLYNYLIPRYNTHQDIIALAVTFARLGDFDMAEQCLVVTKGHNDPDIQKMWSASRYHVDQQLNNPPGKD